VLAQLRAALLGGQRGRGRWRVRRHGSSGYGRVVPAGQRRPGQSDHVDRLGHGVQHRVGCWDADADARFAEMLEHPAEVPTNPARKRWPGKRGDGSWSSTDAGHEPVTFARYTGQGSDEERERILAARPDILLTDYVMLKGFPDTEPFRANFPSSARRPSRCAGKRSIDQRRHVPKSATSDSNPGAPADR
jgi:hypothetical protein